MTPFLKKFATPATAGLSIVSAGSGVALFFHIAPPVFHEMHEWLSMALLIPVTLHLQRNWESLLGYIRRRTFFVPVAASLTAAVLFGFAAFGNHEHRMSPETAMLAQAPLSTLALVLKTSPDAVQASLAKAGMPAHSSADTLQAIAARARTSPERLLEKLRDPRADVRGETDR